MPSITRITAWITPVRAAFFGSLILSLIAIRTSSALNRDGMLYVDTARAFLIDGFGAASAVFTWPFLPILMAGTSKLTGLGLETSGHLLNALFLAGACSLMVDCAERKFPESVWPTCLVLLSLPGLNNYRDEILREYGCWFFFMLSYWLALRWSEVPRWGKAFAVQLALGIAALFRPEALAFFPALTLWQLYAAPKGEKWRRTLMIGGLPLLGLAILVMLFLSGQLESGHRLAGEFNRFNIAGFNAKAQAISSALIPYAQDNARTILFFGSISIIPLKFVIKLGPFLIPLLFLFSKPYLRTTLVRWQPFSWAFLAHLLVLVAFVLDMQFLAGRYVIVLHLLAVPLIGYSLWLLMQRFPRWKLVIILLAGIIMTSNVVTRTPKKTYYFEAGAWLAANAKETPRVYVENPMVTYYAGWRLSRESPAIDRSRLGQAVSQRKYDLLVLESDQGDPDISPWLATAGLIELQRFGRPGGEEIIMAAPSSSTPHNDGSNTEPRREDSRAGE